MHPAIPLLITVSLLATSTATRAQDARTPIPIDRLRDVQGFVDVPTHMGANETRGRQITMDETGTPVSYGSQVIAVPGDEFWDTALGSDGTNNVVRAMVADGSGNLYVGGDFTTAGGKSANYVARWNGSTWRSLGRGVNGPVHALALIDGDLYVGGEFTAAGGFPASYVAKWNPLGWSTLGPGVNHPVYALAVDGNGHLFAGGMFTFVNSTQARFVAEWDGSSWHALGTGTDGPVFALATDADGDLYAGGSFKTAGGVAASRVARWNRATSSWTAIGSGADSTVHALAVWDTPLGARVYAGGAFMQAGGVTANHIARWDPVAASWGALGDGMNGDVNALVLAGPGSLYAGGEFTEADGVPAYYVAGWTTLGASWSAVGSGLGASVHALASETGLLYAGGAFTTAGASLANHVAEWDGSSWNVVGVGGTNGWVWALTADGNGNIYAGGEFTVAGGVSASYVAKWDGTVWSALGLGMDDYVYALATDEDGTLYAGGKFTTAGGVSASRVAKWDGSSWSALGSGIDPGGGIPDPEVYALLVDASGTLYAGGIFMMAGGLFASFVAEWDGSNWWGLNLGLNGVVYALAADADGSLYAGGYFSASGSLPLHNVAKWDPATGTWSALASGFPADGAQIYALAVDGAGSLYAGGYFNTAGSIAAKYVAKWDGATWSALGQGMDWLVQALTVDAGGNLYAGGDFSSAGGVSAAGIAKWDGSTWSALGSGTDNPVFALEVGSLWVGGAFTTAGDKPAGNMARWTGPLGEAPEVSITSFLEGAYSGAGLMSTALNPSLPLVQPFGGSPTSYPGTETVSIMPANVVDWLLMELRSDSTEESTFVRQAALLLDDGSIVDTSGVPPAYWGVSDDSAWVALHARNHLSIMTPQKIGLENGTWSHDFTSAASSAYSRGGMALKYLGDGFYGMFAADADADGAVLFSDYEVYITQTTSGAIGYQTADFNYDGSVDAIDFNLYLANAVAGASSQVP